MVKKFAFVLVLTLTTAVLAAQTTKEILKFARKKEKERQYLRYTVQKIEKNFISADTTIMTGTVSLAYIPSDTTDYAFCLYYTDTTSSFIYNGKDLYALFDRKEDRTWLFYTGETGPQGYVMMGMKIGRYYFQPVSGNYYRLAQKYADSWSRLQDSRVNKEDCYVLQRQHPDQGDLKNFTEEIYIRKEDGLTLRYRYWVDMMEMHQYDDLTLIETDQRAIPLSLFELPPGQAIISEKDYDNRENASLGEVKKGQQVPSWKFVTLDGDSLALDSLKGKVVLLDFFYRTCYPCMKAIPDLVRLQEKYRDRGLIIVGVDPSEEDYKKQQILKEFLAKRNVNYPVVFSPKAFPREVYGVKGYPHTFILDRNGRLVEQHVGWSEDMYAIWEKTILELLE